MATQVHPLESDFSALHPLVSWRSIVAGLLVAFLSLAILLSLGMAFGGIGLDDGTSAQNAGIFTGVWFLVSAIISLFVGSYFAARVSKFHTGRIGSAQGIVITALFFGLFLFQTVSTIGWIGGTAGKLVSGGASAAASGAGSPVIQNVVEDSLGNLNLRQDPQTVLSGVVSRLTAGNPESAKNYLAYQANITPDEADRRINQAQSQITANLTKARQATAKGLQALGWTLFASLILGAAAAMSGGALGSRSNYRRPLTREQVDAVSDMRTAPVL